MHCLSNSKSYCFLREIVYWVVFVVVVVCVGFFFRRICAEWVGARHHMLVICWWNSHMGAFQH